ncbi:MAG: ABC transporter permease [Myxococcales bacterium]|nr:ABC transporter permease [Myxococcales bacterium]
MRDVWLVARFEVLRAIRTWRALALVVLFTVASAGASYLFVRFIGMLENEVAQQILAPRTETPGAMIDELVKSDTWREFVSNLVGADHLVDFIIQIPPLAMFNLWFGFLLVPFFAASASAECISLDVRSRAIRYEVLRTGRLELVTGRFIGQALLTGAAIAVSTVAVLGVGMRFMVLTDPVNLASWLAWFSIRAWVFAIPFIGIGVAASQITASPAWARVMAVGGVALSWVAYALARGAEAHDQYPWLTDVTLQLLPQGWIQGMWEPGGAWLASAVVIVLLGVFFALLGYARFAGRDL